MIDSTCESTSTDVHRSTLCFKKFLNAARFYSADAAIIGGDITGKPIIPITGQPDGRYVCKQGTLYTLKTRDEVEHLRKRIEDQGCYPYLTDQKEIEDFSKEAKSINYSRSSW